MTEQLYHEQIKLEEEARGLTIQRFHKVHLDASKDENLSETFLGSHLLRNYINPYTAAIKEFLVNALSRSAGNNNRTAKYLAEIDAETAAFLFLKAIINKVFWYRDGKVCTVTALAIYGAGLIHDEMRLRAFEAEHPKLSARIHDDFNKRELPRRKREEYMQAAFRRADMEWSRWTTAEMVKIGTTLMHIFRVATGDIDVVTQGTGKHRRDIVEPSQELVDLLAKNADECEALMTTHYPMVVPPLDWSEDTLNSGGYLTHNVTPYPLVKYSKRGYRKVLRDSLRDGKLSRVLGSVNAIQRTKWSINTRVLDVVEWVYEQNIPCGKLPMADNLVPRPPSAHLAGLDKDHEEVKEYRAYCFRIHEDNRRVIGKRVMAARAFHLARKFSAYEAIYFPHDLDSRGRMYPKPSGLNPQGPDYVKGLLQFADAKPLGGGGVFWLGVHGANCWGADKLPIHERAHWAVDHLEFARRVAGDPRGTTSEWTKADNPVQFLAWCFEWAEAWATGSPEEYWSKLHVDLDATCSGLQHFAAMLRDARGGFHVNMTPNTVRQDVYGAVAAAAAEDMKAELGGDDGFLAEAWLKFGIDRSVTKRPVMVKPYAGTLTACNQYVGEAVKDAIDAGAPLPVPEENLWAFKMFGSRVVWNAIPKVVVAADGAMRWLMTVARLVARSQPEERRIEWVTPAGLPVHQYKFDTASRQIKTHFDGRIVRPRITEDLDKLAPRKLANTVAPSFVHSLDAAHLQLTVSAAVEEGIDAFAVVHDSFGVHAADIPRFSRIIREEFVLMYEQHDVLEEFLETALPLISEELQAEIPPLPEKGDLDLQGVLDNPFFFS